MWDWRWYIRVAEGLRPDSCDKPVDSARARAAISRAYYAVYHVTKAYIADVGYELNAPSNRHDLFWRAVKDYPAATEDEREVGLTGERMMTMRIHADYHRARIEADWNEAGKEAKLKKERDRLMLESESAIILAHKICVLLKLPWTPGSKAPAEVIKAYEDRKRAEAARADDK